MQSMTMRVSGLGLGVRAPSARAFLTARDALKGTPVFRKSIKATAPRTAGRAGVLSIEARDIRRPMNFIVRVPPHQPEPEPEPKPVPVAEPVAVHTTNVIPVVESFGVGIMKDISARGPIYANDFQQGISFKSVVSIHKLPLSCPSRNELSQANRRLTLSPDCHHIAGFRLLPLLRRPSPRHRLRCRAHQRHQRYARRD